MKTVKVLHRQVSRLPAGVIPRLDALAEAASRATGKEVSRAAIIRAVLGAGLAAAEGNVNFANTVDCALMRRGRKPGCTPGKKPIVLPSIGDSQ